jgi:hypothetical protein
MARRRTREMRGGKGNNKGSDWKHRKRAMLWEEQQGRCYWCNLQMVQTSPSQPGRPDPPNMATFEHLDSRLTPERGKHAGTRRIVLVCQSCNGARGRLEEQGLPLIELHYHANRSLRAATMQ